MGQKKAPKSGKAKKAAIKAGREAKQQKRSAARRPSAETQPTAVRPDAE